MPVSPENLGSKGGMIYARQVVDQDGCQTLVSWSYPCPPQGQLPKSRSPPIYAKPPHYHHSLFHVSNHGSTSSKPYNNELEIEADDLNPDLVGVKAATDVLQKYEIDVGFYYMDLVPLQQAPPSTLSQSYLCDEVDEEEVILNRERWHDLVQGLTHGILDGNCSSTGLHRSASTLSSIDLSDSERSVVSNSMPSTPKPTCTNVVVKDSPASPDSDHICRLVASRLNASASSFIPTSMTPEKALSPSFRSPSPSSPSTASMSSVSPISSDFTFPSLSSCASSTQSRSPPSFAFGKDERGFYKGVASSSLFHGSESQRPLVARLPPFITDPLHQRKSPSKTRSLVDRLRVSGARTSKSKSVGPSPSPSPFSSSIDNLESSGIFEPRLSVSDDGGDWRSAAASDGEESSELIKPEMNEDDSKTKVQRTRDLRSALERKRAGLESGNDEEKGKDDDIDLGYQFLNKRVAVRSKASSLPPKVEPEVTFNDGWIEGPSPSASRPRKPRSRNCPSLNPNPPKYPSLSSQVPVTPSKPQPGVGATPFVPVSLQPGSYFPTPGMYSTYPYPYAATASYVQMQMHIQSQLQLQMHMQAQSHRPWLPVAYPIPLMSVPAQTIAPRFLCSQ